MNCDIINNTSLSFFMFVFPCIITLYYIKNQLDEALAVLFISHCKITLHVSDATFRIVQIAFFTTETINKTV